MSWRWLLGAGLLLSLSCGEVRHSGVAAGPVATAMAPLREAMQSLVEAQAADRQRVGELAGEVGRAVAALRAGAGSDPDALVVIEQRLSALEAAAAQQRADDELVVRALERTTRQLDEVLRLVRAGDPSVVVPEQPTPAASDAPEDASTAPATANAAGDPTWWLAGIAALGLAILSMIVWRGRGEDEVAVPLVGEAGETALADAAPAGTAAERIPLDGPVRTPVEEAPERVVLAPPPPAHAVRGPDPDPSPERAPIERVHEFRHGEPRVLGDMLRDWLRDEPHVLARPAPRVEVGAASVRARFHLTPIAAEHEAARIASELAALARTPRAGAG